LPGYSHQLWARLRGAPHLWDFAALKLAIKFVHHFIPFTLSTRLYVIEYEVTLEKK